MLVDLSRPWLILVSLYTPNRNLEPNTFFASLTDLIDLTHPVFVARDFNCVLDNLLDRKRRPSFAGGESARQQESGPALQSLLSFTQTYPLWRTMHPGRIAYSWSRASGTFVLRIDMIWAPRNFKDLIKECKYHPSFVSDHQYLLVKCSLHNHIATVPGLWKFNTFLLQDTDYNSLVTSFWQTLSDHPDFGSQLDW